MTREDAIYYLQSSGFSEEQIATIERAFKQEPCDDVEQIDYHDDFATALKKINDYEMTRDERVAISILNAYKAGYESAIEDYKQEPCEDAVSRNAVIKLFNGNIGSEAALILHKVKQLPPVTQKSGEWILLDECANSGYYCSNCQKKLVKEGWSKTVKKINFCPNCGCRMVEPQESEE